MMNLQNLENLLINRGEKAKLSKASDISTGNIADWFNPNKRATPSAEALCKIANYYNCSVDYLIGRTDVKETVTSNSNIIPIKILEQKAAAGLGIGTDDDSNMIKEVRFFHKSVIPVGTDFGIILDGDSMEPKYKTGQVVFIKRADDCYDGELGIFCISQFDQTDVVFKKKVMLSNNQYCLRSLNTAYKDIMDFDENKICYCVAKVLK